MAETGNYQLKQWESTDRILMEDFNADNAKVDQALGILTEQAALIAKCGNARIWSTTYTGNAAAVNDVTCQAPVCTFPEMPLFFLVIGGGGAGIFLGGATSALAIFSDYNNALTVRWTGNTATWSHNTSATVMFNRNIYNYKVFAFLPPRE